MICSIFSGKRVSAVMWQCGTKYWQLNASVLLPQHRKPFQLCLINSYTSFSTPWILPILWGCEDPVLQSAPLSYSEGLTIPCRMMSSNDSWLLGCPFALCKLRRGNDPLWCTYIVASHRRITWKMLSLFQSTKHVQRLTYFALPITMQA